MHLRAALPWLVAAAVALPGAALAHASERMVILTLPTGHYILGAAATVLVTALIGLMGGRLPAFGARVLWERPVLVPVWLTSWLSALGLWALVLVGLLGSRDPFSNLLTLTFWTLLWVGLTLASIFLGNLWRSLNPWTGPVRALRAALGLRGGIGLGRLGYWPAVLGYLAFAWFEIVSLAPDDPAILARVVAGYWLLILVLAVAEGDDWLQQGEAFTVFFGFIARIAPFWLQIEGRRARLMAGLPGAQIMAMPPLPPSAIAFVTLVLAGVSFDGLSETFWWLATIGVNPLEFPGRSAVTLINSAGLAAAWALTFCTILGAIWAGRALAGLRSGFWRAAGPFMLSFLPIAAGYHSAHYLVQLLTGGQYFIAALNDPLHTGASLLGLPKHWVSFGMFQDIAVVRTIWNIQFAAILGAHVLAVMLSLRLAERDVPGSGPTPGGGSALAHVPLTALMVGYTVLGLWLLSSPTGA